MGGEHKIFIPISHFFCVVGTWNSNFASLQFLPFTFRIGCIYHMGNSWNCSVCFFVAQSAAKKNPSNRYDGIWGTITVLLFCGALAVLLYYQCVTNGRLIADKLFLEESLNAICFFLTLPVILFFTPIFALSALILGALREKLSGVLKNLLLLAVGPVGFIIFTGTALRQLGKIHSGQGDSIFSIFAAAVCWVIFMFVPYGFMLWHGKKEQDKMKIHNGIAGIWAVNFFMFGLFLLGYICRGR